MIRYVDYYVPPARVAVDAIFEALKSEARLHPSFETRDDGAAYFKYVLNLEEVADANTISETELLDPVVLRFFDAGIIKPKAVELIILIGDDLNQGTRMSNMGHYIQHSYGMEIAEVVILSGNHCANIEYAISYGESLLKSGDYRNVLVVAVNKLANHDERLVGSYAIKGDAAGLAFLERGETDGVLLLGRHSYTNGVLYEADVNSANSLLLCKNYINCISGLLQKYRLKPLEIDHVIIQNANQGLAVKCLQTAGFSSDQVFLDNLSRYGHLDCIDFLVNLKSLMDGQAAKGARIFSFGIGWAGSNMCLYMQIV